MKNERREKLYPSCMSTFLQGSSAEEESNCVSKMSSLTLITNDITSTAYTHELKSGVRII